LQEIKLISIFGPDGSGKSTQARILARDLIIRGFKVKIVWIKSCHTIAYLLSKIYEKLRRVTYNAYGHVIRIDAINGRVNKSIWALIEFISILPLVLIHVYIPMSMNRIIITERYLVDSIVSIAYTLNDPNFCSSLVAKLMLYLIPRNSILIHLDSDYKEILKRRGNMTDPKDFIEFQRSMYNKLSRKLGAIRIDTSKYSIEQTSEIIRSRVLKSLTSIKVH